MSIELHTQNVLQIQIRPNVLFRGLNLHSEAVCVCVAKMSYSCVIC